MGGRKRRGKISFSVALSFAIAVLVSPTNHGEVVRELHREGNREEKREKRRRKKKKGKKKRKKRRCE